MAEADSPFSALPPDLHVRVLSLLPPNDLALGYRLSCKDAAQRFSQPHHRTARLSQPLPGRTVAESNAEGLDWNMAASVRDAARAAVQLSFRQKLQLVGIAAASGYEANVEFALQLLQPHVFPELLQTDHYLEQLQAVRSALRREQLAAPPGADVGSAAVASGLARLLPSLAQRCPGLLDPGATLEAAARHCDLAGLQAAWEVVGQRLLSSLKSLLNPLLDEGQQRRVVELELLLLVQLQGDAWTPWTVWRRMMAAAAGSPTRDAIAKMAWVLDRARTHSWLAVEHSEVWGAAAASGDLARLRWLQERRFPWGGAEALAAVLRHADLDFIVRMEQEGGFLPPAGDGCWGSAGLAPAAAASPRDSAAKLSWLADRGVQVGTLETVKAAAQHGNLAALQRALQHWRQRQQQQQPEEAAGSAVLLSQESAVMEFAVRSGHVPTAAWLHQAGGKLQPYLLLMALNPRHLPMLRWLLEAGCPIGDIPLAGVVYQRASHTPAEGEMLVEALRMLAHAGAPAWGGVVHYAMGWDMDLHPLVAAGRSGHPWAVWQFLRELVSDDVLLDHELALLAKYAAAAGNEAIFSAAAQLGWLSGVDGADATRCYAAAAKNGDRGTLTCLHRLGVPMGEGVLAAAIEAGAPLPALRWLAAHGASAQSALAPAILGSLESYYRRGQEVREVRAWLLMCLAPAYVKASWWRWLSWLTVGS